MGMCISLFSDSYDKAEKKAKSKDFSTKDNPLFEGRPSAEELRVTRNMRALKEDAYRKSCPFNGHVYEGFMSVRYPKEN